MKKTKTSKPMQPKLTKLKTGPAKIAARKVSPRKVRRKTETYAPWVASAAKKSSAKPTKKAVTTAPRKTRRAKARKKPDLMAIRIRNQTPLHARKPMPASYRVFWSTGMLGGIMVVTASLWSAWRTPTPAPGALAAAPASSELALTQRSPASADPPSPMHTPPVLGPEQRGQQQQQQQHEALPVSATPSASLQKAFEQAAQTAPAHRVAWWSGWLVQGPGNRAELKSLGTGPVIQDTAPLIPDLFNCTIFVETAAALARSSKPELFFKNLIEIRYQSAKPEYLSRNHFPEGDWRPHNASAGTISDVTPAVAQAGRAALKAESKELDRARWLASQSAHSPSVARALAEAGPPGAAWVRKETVRVEYISRRDLPKVLELIPDGAVISFVQKNSPKRAVLITHQGIVVSEGGKVWLRHGSPGGHVRSVLLRDYLRRNVEFEGFTLDQVNGVLESVNS
jgi:hypothetical protein